MKKEYITINVSMETWQMLKSRKQRPSHTFDEIIQEGLFDVEEKENVL